MCSCCLLLATGRYTHLKCFIYTHDDSSPWVKFGVKPSWRPAVVSIVLNQLVNQTHVLNSNHHQLPRLPLSISLCTLHNFNAHQYIFLLLYLRVFRLDLMLNGGSRPKTLLQNHRPFHDPKVETKTKNTFPKSSRGVSPWLPTHRDSSKAHRGRDPPQSDAANKTPHRISPASLPRPDP